MKPALSPDPRPIVESLVHRTVFTPIRQGSAVAETVARLGQAITLGLLRPGDQLPPEARLARSLGISAVTLRGALAILREAGVIETRRGRGGGTFVSVSIQAHPVIPRTSLPSEDELRDLADYRSIVEGGAAALAASRATDEQLMHLETLVKQMGDEEDFDRWSELDTLFHLILADASRSQRLVNEVTELRSAYYQISVLWDPVPVSTMRLSNREHRTILRAVRRRDPLQAQAVMIQHVESTLAFWLGLQPRLATAVGSRHDGRRSPGPRAGPAESSIAPSPSLWARPALSRPAGGAGTLDGAASLARRAGGSEGSSCRPEPRSPHGVYSDS